MSKKDDIDDLLGDAPATKKPAAKKAATKAEAAPAEKPAKEAKTAPAKKAAAPKEEADAEPKEKAKKEADAEPKEKAKKEADAEPKEKAKKEADAEPKEKAKKEPIRFEEGERQQIADGVVAHFKRSKKPINSKDLAAKLETETRKLRVVLYSLVKKEVVQLEPGESKVSGMTVSPA